MDASADPGKMPMRFACKMFVVAALLFPVAAVADEASDKAATARQIVELSVVPGLDGRIARMIGQVAEKLPADKQAQARADLLKASAGTRGDLVAVFATYYAGAFTAAELKELLAFYSSPIGLKVVKVEENKPAAVDAAIQQQIVKLVMQVNAAAGQGR